MMQKISSEISPDDIKIISQVTKSLLEKQIPYDIITKIIQLCYISSESEDKYYSFGESCGSGSDIVLIKLKQNGNIGIILESYWMGGDNNRLITCKGEYKHIYGSNGVSFGLLVINSIRKRRIGFFDDARVEEKIYLQNIYFDFLQFDKWMDTEWGQDLPINLNLYIGGGCQSVMFFNAYLCLNDRIGAPLNDELKKDLSILINGLKLEKIRSDFYEQDVKRVGCKQESDLF